MEGTLKWFNLQKGFGFIERHDGAPDVFLHANDVPPADLNTLRDGQRISFDIGKDRRGRINAVNVQLLGARAA